MMDENSSISDRILSALVEAGNLTEDRARTARRVRAKLPAGRTIISILKELNYVGDSELKEVLRVNRNSFRIGDLLVEFGYLAEEKLKAALDIQKDTPGKQLGHILVEQQFMTELDFLDALSVQLGFPFVNLDTEPIDPVLLERAPTKWCRTHLFLPVKKENGSVQVAFSDPFNKESIKSAKRIYGDGIEIAISPPGAIERYLDRMAKGRERVIDENTASGIVDRIIGAAIDQGASDIHIEPMQHVIFVKFRIDGILRFQRELPKEAAPMVISRIKILSNADIAERRRHQDGRMSYEYRGNSYDLRVSFYAAVFGEKVVLRVLNRIDQIIPIQQIGMQPKMLEHYLEDVLGVPSGVLIITGPTGSGKTTTLYSSIKYIKKPELSIITAEDPVEFVMEGITQCSIDPRINLTYEETLRHVVRQDPDIIVIGEIRDNYSAEVAVHAALTGHKVLTSFHTEDSISGLIRLMNMNIEAFLISSTVVCVLAQRLLRKICPRCRRAMKPGVADLKRLNYTQRDIGHYEFFHGDGCRHCNYTGYKGRIPVFEMLVLNEHVREAILDRKSTFEIRKISLETTNLVTLMEDALSKAVAGVTSLEEIFRCVPRLIPPRSLHEIHRLLGI